ncbi:MAG: hypothetical protein CMP11_03035 [Zetaproteobacteria bacterium]|nr:hypothetical protein [Pseudobdellovibrionaceae bacterium]
MNDFIPNNSKFISVRGAREHNLKDVNVTLPRGKIIAITGVSGSGKSSLAFDTILAESNRRFFYTLSHYARQFLNVSSKPCVRQVTGLSPAIALGQRETQPSSRATVASLSDLNELIGVAMAQFSESYCPSHGLKTKPLAVEEIIANLCSQFSGRFFAICAPIVEMRKGTYEKVFESLIEKGYLKVFCDGSIFSLDKVPSLSKEKKHTIKLVVDFIQISSEPSKRLKASIARAIKEGKGSIECLFLDEGGKLSKDEEKISFSTQGGCPKCGMSWPKIDSRYFSANSLGQCSKCHGSGEIEGDMCDEADIKKTCFECDGVGIDKKYWNFRLGGLNIKDIYESTVGQFYDFMKDEVFYHGGHNQAFQRLQAEIQKTLSSLNQIGLSYLTLSRRVKTLSGGELQRLKLSAVLSQSLSGVLYVLDEPSQGLHLSELNQLSQSLTNLKKLGNTIILVEHDPYLLERSDWIIDVGPKGGEQGGEIVASFPVKDLEKYKSKSLTAKFLLSKIKLEEKKFLEDKQSHGIIEVFKAEKHNLSVDKVIFQMNKINVVSGVSGSGKTSLVIHSLYRYLSSLLKGESLAYSRKASECFKINTSQKLDSIVLIDSKPLAKSSISMIVTYIKVFDFIRKIFASLPASKIAGFTASHFSLRLDQGRCKECKGKGYITLSMKFLEDARISCSSCEGKCFESHILSIKYKGHSIADILGMTIGEAEDIFSSYSKIKNIFHCLKSIGIGYLKLGQSLSSLSGGEAQRLKLLPFILPSKMKKNHLIILDEPTRGLHESDIDILMKAINQVKEKGATLIIIEHHPTLILRSDWLIDLGPGASDKGGRVLYEGVSKNILTCKNSVTAKYLKSFMSK